MLKKITLFFEKYIKVEEESVDAHHALNLAVAALLIEMVKIDNQSTDDEAQKLHQILITQYGLETEEIEQITQLANEELGDATDYYQFTSLINTHFKRPQKVEMVEQLWRIAIADGHLDSHEEHYIRKIADLLFVPHSDFIRTKLKAIEEFSQH